MPHKEAALALADEATDAARAIGAANTLSFGADGAISACQHRRARDPGGARGDRARPGRSESRSSSAPAARRARSPTLREAGAARVAVWNRSADRAAALAADLGVDAVTRPIAADLLVNCTSVGLADGNFKDLPVDADALGTYATVADLVYRAGGTELIRSSEQSRMRGGRWP